MREYEFRIGAHFLSALINADPSGLESDEYDTLTDWEATTVAEHGSGGHWSVKDDSREEFARCAITGKRGECETVTYCAPARQSIKPQRIRS